MNTSSDAHVKDKKEHPYVLLIITSIMGVLYLIFIIENLISEPQNLESTVVRLAFIVFLVGYYYSWKDIMIAGIIFIFWWGIMWYLALFIAEQDKGVGVVMGAPILIIGILFILTHYRHRVRTPKD